MNSGPSVQYLLVAHMQYLEEKHNTLSPSIKLGLKL